jgi:hypothetical protein
VFKSGHRIEIELSSQESFTDAAVAMLPPDSFHLPSGRATTHKIFRDKNHPSYLLLPVIPINADTNRGKRIKPIRIHSGGAL